MPGCTKHSHLSVLRDMCVECNKIGMVEDAAGELFNACKQTRDIIRQVSMVEMSGSIELIKKRLAKAEQICYEAMKLALTGE